MEEVFPFLVYFLFLSGRGEDLGYGISGSLVHKENGPVF